ncbi:SDR family oxidoreductase [Nocardioides sp. WS12]|uniref:SDR family oxidoreductase n=1 Tax=Nocardioides sp. WS12 TaxID=2486272 RepID=UPI0015F833FD|nr:SDR family oxidoreductase [Nocardioides sp. WS12]
MKRIAITGGAQGIGAATAREFAAKGHSVVIGDIDAKLVAETAGAIASDTGATVVGLPLDVTDAAAFATFLDKVEAELGGLDVLVNNAGIMPTGPFLDETDGVSDRQIDINVRAVVVGSKLAGRRFAERGHGQIVNVASAAGLVAAPGVAVYCATKFAVVGLGDALDQELSPLGVTVTTICPGYVNTQLIAGVKQPWLVRKIAFVEPEAISNAIVSSVEKNHGGLRLVPFRANAMVAPMRLLPAAVRHLVAHATGVHDAGINTDESARQAYRDRTEHLDLATTRSRQTATKKQSTK